MTQDERLEEPVRRAVAYTVAAQDPKGGGWRYATNAEVEDLFAQSFSGYYDTRTDTHVSATSDGSAYLSQLNDIVLFRSLFGDIAYGIDGAHYYSLGLYEDEDSILRVMGTYYHSAEFNTVMSTEYTNSYTSTYSDDTFGVYLVRDIATSVPEPSTWLLMSLGMLGILGAHRRKKTKV